MNRLFQIVGLVLFGLGAFFFLWEADYRAPYSYQFYWWGACAAVSSSGYWLYRISGGTWRFLSLFDQDHQYR